MRFRFGFGLGLRFGFGLTLTLTLTLTEGVFLLSTCLHLGLDASARLFAEAESLADSTLAKETGLLMVVAGLGLLVNLLGLLLFGTASHPNPEPNPDPNPNPNPHPNPNRNPNPNPSPNSNSGSNPNANPNQAPPRTRTASACTTGLFG